jgi:hypothetical protein
MPKAKPVSLHPLNFDDAIKALIKGNPKQKTKIRTKSMRRQETKTGEK